jgi:3-hydroxybutyryl-CoA dehydratase
VTARDLHKSVEQSTIDLWAELSGDHNPLHNDPVYARETRYGGTILHGHMTIAWLSEWGMREWGAGWLSLGQIADLRFRAPLRPGTAYVVRGADTEDPAERRLTVELPDGSPGVTATARLVRPDRRTHD